MSLANQALLYNLALLGTTVDDDLIAFSGGTQSGAVPVRSEAARVIGGVLNSSLVLKSITSGEASQLTFVVNDGPNAIKVFCAPGETLNGGANGSLAIPAGQSGIFVRVPNALSAGGDWRAAAIP